MKAWEWVKGLFGILKGFAVRAGFDAWLREHWDEIFAAVVAEIRAGEGLSLHVLQGRLFTVVKEITGSDKDNWVSLAIALVIEAAKAKQLIP